MGGALVVGAGLGGLAQLPEAEHGGGVQAVLQAVGAVADDGVLLALPDGEDGEFLVFVWCVPGPSSRAPGPGGCQPLTPRPSSHSWRVEEELRA